MTIFRDRVCLEYSEGYAGWARKARDLATQMPGFVSQKSFVAEEGERVSLVEFGSEKAQTR